MDIQTIKFFLTLADSGSFTEASEICSITQSTLSKSMRKLEKELGDIELFDRKKRPVSLTFAGKEFHRHAVKIMEDYFNMMNSMIRFQKQVSKPLYLGAIPAMWNFGLFNYINDFKEKSERRFNLELVEGASLELVQKLQERKIDAAFIIVDKSNRFPDLTYFDILENSMCLCVSKSHPFAEKETVSFKEMEHESFISMDENSTTLNILLSRCNENGFTPKQIIMCKSIETVFNLTAANDGISLVSRKTARIINNENVRLINLSTPCSYVITFAVRPDYRLNSAVTHLADFTLFWKYH